ncbi:hypothetical protein EXE41_04105 [Halorubrum sp. SD690R]|uniref:hypothetical protein n=1 Tax=Halorubrum sp. SD690R TaxID=2518117 RepID=UPI0010F696DE|nr:hypothetical protein [Halorubrum sp. SD690R]TKX47745.1 hypothetical protein EXE41_04105 [Halorubrum sp. SD690R]
MTLTDFLRKYINKSQRDGIPNAARGAVVEATSKTVLRRIIDWQSEPIWSDDWDICLVLDSCRWDTWKTVDGRGRPAWSVGGSSLEWLERTFAEEYEEQMARTGYVTANPNTDRTDLLDGRLAYIDELWRDRWDVEEQKTVTPVDVTDRAIWAWLQREQLGFDQLIVHYMQPHAPFRSLGERGGWGPQNTGYESIWNLLRDGEISQETLTEAYADNLVWVLEEVERWEEKTGGDLLVTSDHGNAMGELGEWGHKQKNTGNPVVRRVPWLNIEGTGKDVDSESVDPPGDPPVTNQNMSVAVEERLRGFGYL